MKLIEIFAFATAFTSLTGPAWSQVVAQGSPGAGILLEQQRNLAPLAQPPGASAGVLPETNSRMPERSDGPSGDTNILTVVRSFLLTGGASVEPAAVQAVLAGWVNRPVGLSDLRQATRAVEDLFRSRGWLARVSLPEQDITDGVVRMSIVESRMGRVQFPQGVAPLRPELSARVRSILAWHLPAGEPLNLMALERALLLADDLPGVRVQGGLKASDLPNSTDVVASISAEGALRGDASLDNAGNRATGAERANVWVNLLSPLGLGEQLSLGGSASPGSQYVSFDASAPIPGDPGLRGWRMVGSASALNYRVLERRNNTTGLAPDGTGTTLGASLQYPLVRTALSNWAVSAGVLQTRLHNRDDNVTLGSRETVSRTRIDALSLSLNGNQFDRWYGGGAISAGLALVSGDLSLRGSPRSAIDNNDQSVSTQGRFTKLRWNASRLQTLGVGTSLLAATTGQFASTNLDASEKMYLGGMNGVRAYPNAEAGGSTGTRVSLDLLHELDARWQISAFCDWGQVQQFRNNVFAGTVTPLVVRNSVTLRGAGLGLLWRLDRGVQLKAMWARRLGNNPLATSSGADTDGSLHRDRLWLNASITF